MKPGKKLLISTIVLFQLTLVTIISFSQSFARLIDDPRFTYAFYSVVILNMMGFTWMVLNEINQHKKIKKDLHNYIGLVDHTQILTRNMQDEIISWNKGMEKLYGWNKKEAVGQVSHQLFSAVYPRPLDEIKKIVLYNNQWQGELKHTLKNGQIIDVSSHWALLRDEQGRATAIMETINDITVLKQAERQIALLSREINKSNDAIYTLDANQKIQSWNNGAERLYGYSREEALGRNAMELLHTHATEEHHDEVRKQLSERNFWIGDLKRKTKQDRDVYVYDSASTIREKDGTITGYVSVSQDISSQKKLQERANYLAKLVDQCTDAIISIATDGTILSWNTSAETLFGFSAMEAVGQDITIIIPPEYKEEGQTAIQEIIMGKQVRESETQRIRKDGSRIFISLHLSAITDTEGTITGIAGIARNISERREAEQKISQSQENLRTIFDNTSEGFILTDAAGIVQAYNQRMTDHILVNLQHKIQVGKDILDIIDNNRKPFIRSVYADVLMGKAVQYDHFCTSKSGVITWVNFTYTPVKKNNAITGVCIMGRDITDKKITAQQIEFDRNNLNALINNTRDLMWSVDCNFKLITSNQAFDNLLGTQARDTRAGNIDLLSLPSRNDLLERCKQYYKRAFAGETFTEINHNFLPAEYWSEDSFYPIYERDLVVGTACFSRNISEQKKAGELLQESFNEKQALADRMYTILNTLPANIAMLNEKGIIVDVNNSWRRFADGNRFQGNDYGIGQNYLALAEGSVGAEETDGRKVANGIRSVLDNRETEFIFEYPSHHEQVNRWFRMVVTPFSNKEYAGALVMHVDISELRQLYQEKLKIKLNEQKKTTKAILQAQEKERNQLGRDLHDNICQVLAALKMKLNFSIRNDSVDVSLVTECINNLEDAILETRNISHRMIIPRFAESSLTDALKNLCHTYSHEKREVTLDYNLADEEAVPVEIKETLYRIAQEQLQNIEKYAGAAHVKFFITTHPALIRLVIEDDGVGFDTQKKRYGVGLTNIRNRTESLNGRTKIISSPGEGCVLMVEIPLQEKTG